MKNVRRELGLTLPAAEGRQATPSAPVSNGTQVPGEMTPLSTHAPVGTLGAIGKVTEAPTSGEFDSCRK